MATSERGKLVSLKASRPVPARAAARQSSRAPVAIPKAEPAPSTLPDSAMFSRAAWLADVLRQRILSGDYQPGERIVEATLKAECGFSNGPIREALQAIVADGLAIRVPNQGIWVKEFSDAQIVELFQVRTALLEYAAEFAARRCTSETIESALALREEVDAWYEQLDKSAHPSFNGSLSEWLIERLDNDAMRSMWKSTELNTLVYVNASLLKSRGAKTRALIHKLIDHICSSNAGDARATVRTLTQQNLEDLGIDGAV